MSCSNVDRNLPFGSWYLLWNLQTLELKSYGHQPGHTRPSALCKMPHLRHVMLNKLTLPNIPFGKDDIILENLQTLSRIKNLKFSEEVVGRMPNIKKLVLSYDVEKEGLRSVDLNNLYRLQNLTCLHLYRTILRSNPDTMQNICLPNSLKKLYLVFTEFLWEDMNTKIGSLPFLEFLLLYQPSCKGSVWETIEGQFRSLKFLRIMDGYLRCWTTDATHFPRLEHLVLQSLSKLEEIPLSIADISTLQSIKVNCSKSANASAKKIKEKQLSYGNEDLQVLIGGRLYHPIDVEEIENDDTMSWNEEEEKNDETVVSSHYQEEDDDEDNRR